MGPEKLASYIRGYRMFVRPAVGQHRLQRVAVSAVLEPLLDLHQLLPARLGHVRMEHHGIEAAHLPHDGAYLVGKVDGHLAAALLHDLVGYLGHPQLVRRVEEALQQADGYGVDVLVQQLLHGLRHHVFVERDHLLPEHVYLALGALHQPPRHQGLVAVMCDLVQQVLVGVPLPLAGAALVQEDVFVAPLGDHPHLASGGGDQGVHHGGAGVHGGLHPGQHAGRLAVEVDPPVLQAVDQRLPEAQRLVLGGSRRLADGEVAVRVHDHHVGHGPAGVAGDDLHPSLCGHTVSSCRSWCRRPPIPRAKDSDAGRNVSVRDYLTVLTRPSGMPVAGSRLDRSTCPAGRGKMKLT